MEILWVEDDMAFVLGPNGSIMNIPITNCSSCSVSVDNNGEREQPEIAKIALDITSTNSNENES